jgi:DNA mismatch repair protein MutS
MNDKFHKNRYKIMIVSYLKLQEEYSEKYGDRTVVLMQVGSFYETYEYDPSKDTEVRAWPDQRLGHSVEIGGLLNMVVTRKDKGKPYSLTNVDMVGFPMVAYAKHRDVLLSNDFTIVRVDQKKDASGKVERFVGEVLSPATQIENLSQVPMANNIVSLYIEVLEESRNFEDFTIAVGTSCVDVTTGENKVLEVYSRDQNNVFPLQEIYRFLSSVRPRETICHLVYK